MKTRFGSSPWIRGARTVAVALLLAAGAGGCLESVLRKPGLTGSRDGAVDGPNVHVDSGAPPGRDLGRADRSLPRDFGVSKPDAPPPVDLRTKDAALPADQRLPPDLRPPEDLFRFPDRAILPRDSAPVGSHGSGGSGGPGPGTVSLSFSNGSASLFVPSAAGGAPIPLVILLHGDGETGAGFLARCNVAGIFGGRNAILAAPDDNTGSSAVALVNRLFALYNVDTRRVYGFGHSRGAGYLGSLIWSPTQVDVFAGIIINALAKPLPSAPPAATATSPAVGLCGDPVRDGNFNIYGGGVAFASELQQQGYATMLVTHSKSHSIPVPEITPLINWLFVLAKSQ